MWRENETVQVASRPSTVAGPFGIPGTVKIDGRLECQRWETCRDRFQTSGAKLQVFWFRTGATSGQDISAFFDKIETRLKAKKSQFGPTNCAGIIWVKWSPFWRKYSMRRSLFTALLRASLSYRRETDNFDETLYQNPEYRYLSYTKPAFEYFMEGNTIYTGAMTAGWQNNFYNVAKERLAPLLRKPVKPATA